MIARITAARREHRFCATPGCGVYVGQRRANRCEWCCAGGARVTTAIAIAIARRAELRELAARNRRRGLLRLVGAAS